MSFEPLLAPDGDEFGELLPTRASLLERLRQWSDSASWQEFFDTYWKLIYRTARAAGLRPQDAEEVVQETIVEVAEAMPGFRYIPPAEGGSFKEWLLTKTCWRILDHLRRERRRNPGGSADRDADSVAAADVIANVSPTLEAKWDHEWKVTLVERALQRLKRRVDARKYQIFYLSEIKKWKAREVARQLGVGLAAVYTAVFRIRPQFRAILKQLKEE